MTGRNNLYAIFSKPSSLHILIVGGGNVAEEKLTFLTKSRPNAKVTMVSPMLRKATKELALQFDVEMIVDEYNAKYLYGEHMVIATTDVPEVNVQIYKERRNLNVFVNVADNPTYCDFYMGDIVTKGNVKTAISTKGRSQTSEKGLSQFFEDVVPDDIDQMVKNLNDYRKTIKGNFEEKVEKMNQSTRKLVEKV